MKKTKVFIVIVTHNGEKWIEKCLLFLEKNRQNCNVIVVDNNSSDETIQIVKKSFPDVLLIEQKENLGFGQANNIGIRKAYDAGAEYVFLLNQDAWVEPDTLKTLVKVAKKNPEYGVISPIHLNGKGDGLDLNFSNYIVPRRCPRLYSDAFLGRPLKDIYEAEYVNAAAWLLPRKTIEIVGGFDPIFFHYGEDDNYIQRARFHGLKIGVSPLARIYHDREDRPPGKLKLENQLYRKSLTHYADVNIEGPVLLNRRIKRLQLRYWLWVALLLPQKEHIQQELKVLKSIRSKVSKSWNTNRKVGINHL